MAHDQDLDELIKAEEQIIEITQRFGLDPFPVFFELVTSYKMYEDAAYGLPGRFNHWTRGKAFYRMKTQYDYGLSKIYEVVFNTNPAVAYLMEQNDLLQNKLVIAHVMGHSDFFKNNAYFQHTSRRMIDKVGIHADRIRKYEFDHGTQEVERFLDAVLSIEEHIDPNAFSRTHPSKKDKDEPSKPAPGPYDDLWDLEKQDNFDEEEGEFFRKPHKFPPEPEKDILRFLAEHAPGLEDWQRDIIMIVREEMIYFLPQMQTKVCNEGWACLVGNSLVLTDQGLIRYDALHDLLVAGRSVSAGSGSGELDHITDRHVRRNAPTIRLHTRRGLVIEGAEEHKLNIGPDQWIALKDVAVGQRIPLSVGDNLWAKELVPLARPMRVRIPTVEDVAVAAGVGMHTVYRPLGGKTTYARDRILAAITGTGYQFGLATKPIYGHRLPLVAPTHVTEEFAEFLGYLIGDGNIHVSKGAIGYTTGDRLLADRYAALVTELFAIQPKPFWDAQTANGNGGRWRVVFYSANVLELLHSLGIDLQAKARQKHIPDVILRSPKSVVSAFLRAYFDCDGCASVKSGVILSSFSDDIALTIQILLLNYGILSTRHGPNIHICDKSAEIFERKIGFGLPRKQEKLRAYLASHRWFLKQHPTDEVITIEHGMADVYDITVDRTHRYVANGMLHHNSLWHARIMREMDLSNDEVTKFAQMHAGVLAPARMHLNPYHLGYKILEDIERRWDNPTKEEQERFGRKPGQGRAKLFEVRELENDVSLLRNYLTKELIEDLDLYLYRKEGDEWVIVEKDWRKVRDGIVASMTNFGYPYLVIDDADYRRNSELYIKHHFEGQELDLIYGEKTLQYVYQLWGRPVHLETVYDGRRLLLSYDGDKNLRTNLDRERGQLGD
jgi:stage V sporulation protein R